MTSKRMKNDPNRWYCSFRYVNLDGETKQKKKEGFSTKKEADEYERNFLNNIKFNPEMNFKSLYKMYLEDMKPRIKEHTLTSKEYIIENKILPYFKDMKISEIGSIEIQRWQNSLLQAKNPKTNKPYAPTYLKTINNQLTAIFNYAVKFHNLKNNPVHKVGTIGEKNAPEKEIWSIEEFNEFISLVEDKTLHLGFNILYWSGCRIGELLALTWADIDVKNNIINIDKSYQRLNCKDVITEPKTKKSIRKITVISDVIKEIESYKKLFYKPGDNDRIFNCTKYKFEHAMINICNRNNLKRIRIHDLRHSHASLLLNEGINIVALSKRLGHEKVSTTLNTYSHMIPSEDKILNVMENLSVTKS